MRDSLAVFPGNLKSFTKVFAPDLQKLSFDFEKTKFDPRNPEHIEYSKRDSEALLESLVAFDHLLMQEFGVHMRVTTASTAIAAWQRTIPKKTFYENPIEVEDYVRDAYYGGLVFLTDTNPHNTTIFNMPCPCSSRHISPQHSTQFALYQITTIIPLINSKHLRKKETICISSKSNFPKFENLWNCPLNNQVHCKFHI